MSLGAKSFMAQTKMVPSMGKLLLFLFQLSLPPPLQSNLTFFRTAGLDLLRLGQIFLNVDVCLFAAKMGHLEILEYAVEDGCPWVPEMCLEAAEANRQDHVVDCITDNPPQPTSSDSHDSEPESDSLSE